MTAPMPDEIAEPPQEHLWELLDDFLALLLTVPGGARSEYAYALTNFNRKPEGRQHPYRHGGAIARGLHALDAESSAAVRRYWVGALERRVAREGR